VARARSKAQTAPNPEHEQKPADETIAAGEHMDLELMDETLEGERRAGAASPTGVILPAPSQTQNPYVSEEMQGMEMIPKTVGPPQYGSPDPASSASRLMTLEDGHPLAGVDSGTAAISEDYGADVARGDQPGPEMGTLPPSEQGGTAAAEVEAGTADTSGNGDVNATDGAKEYANEHGIDLSQVQGSGDEGRISKADVEQHVAQQEEQRQAGAGDGTGDGNDGNNN
jgi:pyruvate/2-oxoglutarate dehydrogenase complex dihydrolipoamide acyltransferase (E2) component